MSQNAMALIILILIIILAVGLVIALVKWGIGARRTDMSGFEIVPPGGGMRRGIIRIGEWAAILFVVLFTLLCAAISTIYSYVFSGFLGGITNGEIFRTDPQTVVALAAMWGGVSGFLIAALITAPVFVLSQIEMNTRRTAAMLERLAQPRR
jgi:hypothetical protein